MTCPECSKTMPARKSTGRPALYCSPACRRAAEYAIRRAQVLLTRAQRAEQDATLRVVLATSSWDVKDSDAKRTFWSGEVERLRASMRELLAATTESEADSPGTTEPRP